MQYNGIVATKHREFNSIKEVVHLPTAKGIQRDTQMSLADKAVFEIGKQPGLTKAEFEQRCQRFLELNSADAADYAELKEMLSTS